ncbi:MAG: alpha/beta hydrolase family protein [Flavobacteriales bacterium]
MTSIQRQTFIGANGRRSLYELSSNSSHRELILFIHGFMGFMDWGAWHLVRDYFSNAGYDFCRFNLSHNGGTPDAPFDFPDEAAFGQNTYSKELFDISAILNHIESWHRTYAKIHLIGHSRGGGMAILAAQQWQQVSPLGQVCTWAAICDIERRFPQGQELEEWRNKGVKFVKNGRTLQALPQNYELYLNYERNKAKLDILSAAKEIGKRMHIFHGDQDTAVPITEAYELQEQSGAHVCEVSGADHVFGAAHPWTPKALPTLLEELCNKTLATL